MLVKQNSTINFFFKEILTNISKLDYLKKKFLRIGKDLKNLQILKKERKYFLKNQKETALLVGEIIKKVRLNKFMIKSNTGTKYVALSPVKDLHENLEDLTRIGFDPALFSIFRKFNVDFDPILHTMIDRKKEFVSYLNVGGLEKEKEKLREIMELSLKSPEIFSIIGISVPKGVLLYGPPGTGKTLLAKSIASNVNSTFIKMVGSGIVDRYIGESARIVREIFAYAKKFFPSIIFIDEIDAIGGKRLTEGNASDREIQRTLIELLSQIDGFGELKSVKMIMATNRPDVLDPALVRPGRIDRRLKIDLPDLNGRLHIFSIYLKKIKHAIGIDLNKILKMCNHFSGSDLKLLAIESALSSLRCNRKFMIERDLLKSYRKVRKAKY